LSKLILDQFSTGWSNNKTWLLPIKISECLLVSISSLKLRKSKPSNQLQSLLTEVKDNCTYFILTSDCRIQRRNNIIESVQFDSSSSFFARVKAVKSRPLHSIRYRLVRHYWCVCGIFSSSFLTVFYIFRSLKIVQKFVFWQPICDMQSS
jgi:hypothetical protein